MGGHRRTSMRGRVPAGPARPGAALLCAALLLVGCTANTGAAERSVISAAASASASPSVPALPTISPSPITDPTTSGAAGPSPTTANRVTPTTGSPPPRSTITVTRTLPGASRSTAAALPPPPTSEPAGTPGDCPYLDAGVVSLITGQRHGPTTLVAVTPYPICQFVRSDGRPLATVRFVSAADPTRAAAAVDAHVPVPDSQPASQPAGWSGGSRSVGGWTADADAMSVYAVSRGNVAVIVTENESPSVKARALAVCAIHGAGLAAAPVPDYCAAG